MISEDDYIRIGVITGAHGLDGRVKVLVTSDIEDRFARGTTVVVSSERSEVPRRIEEYIPQKGKTALYKALSD